MKARHWLVLPALLACTAPARALDPATMKDRTAFIATRYLEIWSSNDATSITASRPCTVQWPDSMGATTHKINSSRRSVARSGNGLPGATGIAPAPYESFATHAQKCAARSMIDVEVSNALRGTAKRGSAKFDLGTSFAEPRPRIFSESGRLNGQGAQGIS